MTDVQLLDQFVTQRSEQAFAELVSRHISWVTAAARRRLRDSALAEDATQAVFVLLAQKASSLRRETVLSAWLFAALRYVCLATIRSEKRRKRREVEAAVMRESTNQSTGESTGVIDGVWGELAEELDEVVSKLGGTDRRAVLLRFYENKTFVQVGESLGVSEEAARKRVERAVDKLAVMFRRRGVNAPANAIGAAMLAQMSIAGTSGNAAGVASAALAGLSGATPGVVKSAASMILLAQVKAAAVIVAASLAVVAAGGAGVAIVRAAGSAKPRAVFAAPASAPAVTVATTAPVAAPGGASVTFAAGQVFSPDEKPVAAARVTLVGNDDNDADRFLALANSTSNSDGRFHLNVPAKSHPASVLVDAPPYAYGVGYITDDPQQAVVLTEAQTVEATFLLPDGSPAVDLDVAPHRCNGGNMMTQDFWAVEFPEEVKKSLAQRTDGHGKCRFQRMPGGTNVLLDVRDERFARLTYADGVTTGKETLTSGKPVTLQPAASIAGRVAGLDGKGAGGVMVIAQSTDNSGQWGVGVTDAQGTYRLTRLGAGRFDLILTSAGRDERNATQEWTAAAREKVVVKSGEAVTGIDFAQERGTIVKGKVTLKETGAPVAGIYVYVSGPSRPESGGAVESMQTRADGTYAIRVPAGKQHMYIGNEAPDGYEAPSNTARDVTTTAGKDATVNFTLGRMKGKTVSGVVRHEDGSAAPGAYVSLEVTGEGPPFQERRGMKVDAQGRFTFQAVTRGTRLRAALGRMGTEQAVDVNGGEKDVALVLTKVAPITLKGQVVDAQQKGIAGASVWLTIRSGNYGQGVTTVPTDAQGNYSIDGLRLGEKYSLEAKAKRFGRAFAEVQLTRGEKVHTQTAIALPPALSVVTGTVVDAAGKALAGVEVRISGQKTYEQMIKTNASGEFEFADVVDGDSVYVRLLRDGEYANGGGLRAGTMEARVVFKPAKKN